MQAHQLGVYFERSAVEKTLPRGAVLTDGVYENGDGSQWRWQDDAIQDVVRLSDEMFLLACSQSPSGDILQSNRIVDSDWVHIQFRLSGSGCENISQTEIVPTPDQACIVARYPQHSVVERRIDKKNKWKFACLLATPGGLATLLDVNAARLPEYASWMATDGNRELQSSVLPLQAMMAAAVNDILHCPFRGESRRAYMRGKALELLSTVIFGLGKATEPLQPARFKLSHADFSRISSARAIIVENPGATLTLAALSQRVGLNRTKLALGFKQIYGTTVHAFWRDTKFAIARQLLIDGNTSVSDVAFNMGYSKLSSFTRTFHQKFGVLPRECKKAR